MNFSISDIIAILGVSISLLSVVLFLFQWRRSRKYIAYAEAKLPVLSFNQENFPIEVTVVNIGERQFSLDRLCIWLNSRNSLGQEFDISLTEIGKIRLEDGDKLRKTVTIQQYLEDLSDKEKVYFGKVDRFLPWRLDVYFETTTKHKIPVKVSPEAKKKILSEIKKDHKKLKSS